ncbi:hypothetical protein SAY86_020328 [Trapa natans]|uniref:Uncharacterized protein n=1 Tax=Trapa natans TaxID=22666 RepID=A0AAN7LPM8_TRANT|nr:hypothetical protein SAY86_020328 [Trapa natans]
MDTPTPLIISTVLILLIFILAAEWWRRTSATGRNRRLPPSLSGLPVIGNLHQLGTDTHRTLQSLAKRYGPIMRLHMGRVPVVIISSARLAREVMKTHDIVFSDRPKLKTAYRLLYEGNDLSFAPYGEYWRQMRSICVLQLLSSKKVHSIGFVREEEAASLVERISESFPTPVDLSNAFATMTNNIICRVALGRTYSGSEADGRKLHRMLTEMVILLGGFNVGDYIPSLGWIHKLSGSEGKEERVAKEIDDFIEGVLEEHTNKLNKGMGGDQYHSDSRRENKDFVDTLLEIQRDNSAGFPLSRVSIKAIILDMFAAGTDTTYTVLEWAMTELLRHPSAMKKLQDEVRRIVGGRPRIADEDLVQMHYLKAVLKETLRLYPPIPLLVFRRTTQDIVIDGYDVTAGTMVITNAWAIGRDPASWGPDADEFKPERFLDNPVDYKGHDFELIPFGAGRRGCPGMMFAMSTNEMVLANLMLRFNWELPEGMKAEDLDMSQSSGLTIHRKVPLRVVGVPQLS